MRGENDAVRRKGESEREKGREREREKTN